MAIKIPHEVIASIENKKFTFGGKNYRLKFLAKNPKNRDGAMQVRMNMPQQQAPIAPLAPMPAPMGGLMPGVAGFSPTYIQGPPPELVLDPIITVGPHPSGGISVFIDPNAILYQNGMAIDVDARYAGDEPVLPPQNPYPY